MELTGKDAAYMLDVTQFKRWCTQVLKRNVRKRKTLVLAIVIGRED